MQEIVKSIQNIALQIAEELKYADFGYTDHHNSTGDTQLKLDVKSDAIIEAEFRKNPLVRALISEEKEEALELRKDARLIIAYDPLDGSSLVDVNFAVGSIFGIYEDEISPASLKAAIYCIYGPRLEMVVCEDAPKLYRLNREGKFSFVKDLRLQQKGVKMGDQLQLNGSERLYQVVGFTEDNSFFTQPVIFMTLDDFRELKYGSSQVKNISALVVKDDQKIEEAGLSQLSMRELIENIPGYQAQVLTFSFMIGAMVLITFLVLGIFMYIITIQKTHLYGIMRAQGIASRKIIASIFWQIFILSTLGISLAVLALLGTQLALPASVPFYSDWRAYGGLIALIVLMSLAGGLLSIRRVLKIDPITAIGGE